VDETSGRENVRRHAASGDSAGIAGRNIAGYRGAELFIREDDAEVEFVTLLRFESMDAVKTFAGEDRGKPVIYPKAEPLLRRMDRRSQHYRIVPLD
jgi:antibiotic biosynthesis monooxygenase (ABM) superfamily enzyme